MKDIEDYWAEEEFEDQVSAVLIACFETNVKKNKGAAPADRLSDIQVARMRAEGPYVPSSSRFVVVPGDTEENEEEIWTFDLENDPLPKQGCMAFSPTDEHRKQLGSTTAYLVINHIRQVSSLGEMWHRRSGGTLYEFFSMYAEGDGIGGERRYFTVDKEGKVVPCQQKIPNSHGYNQGVRTEYLSHDELWLKNTASNACVALQYLADRRFSWTITAQEKIAKAHLGCMQEEVKSLLYARSLPLSATGRKRPILHLVESHKRRLKSGIDIDISSFLRGLQVVEIGGTAFKVQPPAVLQPKLSEASQVRYYK